MNSKLSQCTDSHIGVVLSGDYEEFRLLEYKAM
jgi:hypothetical protein